jgi:hypothetical protein
MTLDLTNATSTELLKQGQASRFVLKGREVLDEFKTKTREKVTIIDTNNQGEYEGIVEIDTPTGNVTSTKTFNLINN